MANKYGNKKVMYAGQKFDSKLEAHRWAELEIMRKAGLIGDLRRQVPFELIPAWIISGYSAEGFTKAYVPCLSPT